MKLRFWMLSIFAALILSSPGLWAQDLGPGFTKVKDGIYVFASKEGNSTCSIILTEEGVVIIDSCQTPMDGRALMVGVKKLTDKPIRFIINLRPFVTIPDVLASYKLMKSLNPEVVVPGHGPVSTTKIFDEYEGFYTLLLKRVTEMANQGKSLDEIKKDLKMPEYADWAGQDRLGVNIDVAYKSVKK